LNRRNIPDIQLDLPLCFQAYVSQYTTFLGPPSSSPPLISSCVLLCPCTLDTAEGLGDGNASSPPSSPERRARPVPPARPPPPLPPSPPPRPAPSARGGLWRSARRARLLKATVPCPINAPTVVPGQVGDRVVGTRQGPVHSWCAPVPPHLGHRRGAGEGQGGLLIGRDVGHVRHLQHAEGAARPLARLLRPERLVGGGRVAHVPDGGHRRPEAELEHGAPDEPAAGDPPAGRRAHG
jgi:hypothetical protein